MNKIYYQAPSDAIFESVKQKCIEVWLELDAEKYKNDAGYRKYIDANVEKLCSMKNIGDNFMVMLSFFDLGNLKRVAVKCSSEEKKEIRDRFYTVEAMALEE